MSDYLLSNIFGLDISVPGLPNYTDKASYTYLDEYPYAHLNQLLQDNMQGSPDEVIKEIEEILSNYSDENNLAKFLRSINVRIDYKDKYWGGFKDSKEFLNYIIDYLDNQ